MTRRSLNTRVAFPLVQKTKQDVQMLSKAFHNIRITEIDVQNMYTNILGRHDLLEEFFKGKKTKKGNLDSIVILSSLFLLAVGLIVTAIIFGTASPAFSADSTASALLGNANTMLSRIGNTGFLFAAIALIIFNLIGAYLLVTSPIFVIIDIVLMPITIYIAAVISNSYESSLTTLTVVNPSALFPVLNFIMLHLPTIIIVADIITAIAAYAYTKDAR
jgi:hypothetical protein